MIAVETMDTVSLSSSRIFIFAEGVPEALSPADTILEMYPDTACTTSMVLVVFEDPRAQSDQASDITITLLSTPQPAPPARINLTVVDVAGGRAIEGESPVMKDSIS